MSATANPPKGDLGIEKLNGLHEGEAKTGLQRTCGSLRWVTAMLGERPFRDRDYVFSAAARHWAASSPHDLLEAFSHHPRIGDPDSAKTENDARGKAWAEQEQAGADGASLEVKRKLAEGNRSYEQKFGHVYLVCATGKTAEAMLALLQERMAHDPAEELSIAAAEQEKITRIRLERWLSE